MANLGFLPSLEKVSSFCHTIRIPAIPAKGTVLETDATRVSMSPILVHAVQTGASPWLEPTDLQGALSSFGEAGQLQGPQGLTNRK